VSSFFVRRPIVAIVISILTVLLGIVSLAQLPVAQFPDIAPPAIQLATSYVGADALTVEQAVATPIEQQMSGVDESIYMCSVNTNAGNMTLYV
jgi:HAE1 family hydrophobic/amphiphilic exporter-1